VGAICCAIGCGFNLLSDEEETERNNRSSKNVCTPLGFNLLSDEEETESGPETSLTFNQARVSTYSLMKKRLKVKTSFPSAFLRKEFQLTL
jgi:hypothetical protein